MKPPTKDVREVNAAFASGMFETGGNLIVLALMFGGSAFFIQWAIWFIAVGWAVSATVNKASDATDWVSSKLPENPFKKKDPNK